MQAPTTETTTLVVFGATGDLTKRLLLPGLGTLLKAEPSWDVTLVGTSRHGMPNRDWADVVQTSLLDGGCPDARAARIADTARFEALDAGDPEAVRELLETLPEPAVLYFALPPQATMAACATLAATGLREDIRLGIEKPFGTDLASAQEFNQILRRVAPEERIFRVDHFLGKSTVLNLLGLRFANRVFEPVWNAQNIERVEIVADETLALEGRAGYYDTAGALKDMIQSHLLLVMAMFAMEAPARLDAVEVRDLMAHTLRATRLWGGDPVVASRRARYVAGRVNGRDVPDYVDEPGVDPANDTETLAEVTVEVNNARWAGVPIRLRSGKALGDGYRGITIAFRPMNYLSEGFGGEAPRNVLSIGMTPETIGLSIATNAEAERWQLDETVLATQLGASPVRPYGQILQGILSGDPLLSVRGDIAEECWRILTPVVESWRDGRVGMDEYRAGSSGPASWV